MCVKINNKTSIYSFYLEQIEALIHLFSFGFYEITCLMPAEAANAKCTWMCMDYFELDEFQ